MMSESPLIDERTEKEITLQVQELIKKYQPAWNDIDPKTGRPSGVSAALINIFARYSSLIIQRLNRAPEKNFLAFLDLLGASLLPPEPARVPVTFSLTPGSIADAVVPPGTQVAAPAAEGEKDPVIYETEQELVVTAAQLMSLFVLDPINDRYADQSNSLVTPTILGAPVFAGIRPMDHILYVSSDLFGLPELNKLSLTLNVTSTFDNKPELIWEFWNGGDWEIHLPSTDQTTSLTQQGAARQIVFTPKAGERKLEPIPQSTVNSIAGYWIRCRLGTPIKPPDVTETGVTAVSNLPEIRFVSVSVDAAGLGSPATGAVANQAPVDLTKDFFPFGEKPRFGDTLYLASHTAFSQAGAIITLTVTLTDPSKVERPEPKDRASDNLQLTWEFWNGTTWLPLGNSSLSGPANGPFTDTTNAFTSTEHKGVVKLKFPADAAPPALATISGITSYWIRVRLSQGNYGKPAHYESQPAGETDPAKITGYKFVPETFAPPSISTITIDYSVTQDVNHNRIELLAYNDFKYGAPNPTASFRPFEATKATDPSLYLGVTLPPNRTAFPNRPLSLYFRFADVLSDRVADNPTPSSPPRLVWEYWSGFSWARLFVGDATSAFTHSGLVELLLPADFAQSIEFGLQRYWLRVRWESGSYTFDPNLRTVLLNTTTAAQLVTITNEVLGSSNGNQNQIFHTTRAAVLKNQQLEVRESELPSAEDQAKLQEEEGEDVVSVVADAAGRPKEIWVRWHPVPDFYGSGPHDRHYVIDHLNGEIRFGDGVSGKIPPVAVGNIRMSLYRTGGGSRGNRAPGAIIQLKTTIPYVNKVINYDDASGGSEAETLDSLIQRAPRTIRHRDRAVTIEDYEDLAILSTPEVARAKCLPLHDLFADPDAAHRLPGKVSIIIVPPSTGLKPLPSRELLERVQSYVDAHRIPTADLVIVGPDYVRVDVEVEIALTSLNVANEVGLAVNAILTSFLHPLTGGLDAIGWDFGRQPYESDLYALLESIPGVDHIRSLKKSLVPDRAGAENTDHFLVYAGTITATLMVEEP